MKTKTWKVITNTGKQADLESGGNDKKATVLRVIAAQVLEARVARDGRRPRNVQAACVGEKTGVQIETRLPLPRTGWLTTFEKFQICRNWYLL
jgi:hypothetical protein